MQWKKNEMKWFWFAGLFKHSICPSFCPRDNQHNSWVTPFLSLASFCNVYFLPDEAARIRCDLSQFLKYIGFFTTNLWNYRQLLSLMCKISITKQGSWNATAVVLVKKKKEHSFYYKAVLLLILKWAELKAYIYIFF